MTSTTTNPFDDDHLHEECAVFGIYGTNEANINTALGLHALQHRGQEAAGIVSFDGSHFHAHRGLGHVGMRMRVPFEGSVKHSLHGRYVHDVFVSMRTAKHEWFQSGIQNKRRH